MKWEGRRQSTNIEDRRGERAKARREEYEAIADIIRSSNSELQNETRAARGKKSLSDSAIARKTPTNHSSRLRTRLEARRAETLRYGDKAK